MKPLPFYSEGFRGTRRQLRDNRAWGLATRIRRGKAPCTITLRDAVRVPAPSGESCYPNEGWVTGQ